PLALLSCMEHYIEEHRRGAFAIGAPNDEVVRVTGRPAEPFEAVARRLAALPENRRSASRTLREFARFMWVPFARGPQHPPIRARAAHYGAGGAAVFRRIGGVAARACRYANKVSSVRCAIVAFDGCINPVTACWLTSH